MTHQLELAGIAQVLPLPPQPATVVTTTPLSRKTDPHTSHDAAARADTFRAIHEAKIYRAICEAEDGATMNEIASVTNLEPVQVGRRLSAMGYRGLITRVEIYPGRFNSRNGCAVWWQI